MSKAKLKLCPFCKDKAKILSVGKRFRVYCNTLYCGIGPLKITKAEAKQAWNRRAK